MGKLETIVDLEPQLESFEAAVRAGLGRSPKSLPCKFFYDERGSALFDRICELDEYYPTRTERGILEDAAGEIAALAGPAAEIVELGAGSVTKVQILLEALESPAGFTGLDISREHIIESLRELSARFPDLPVSAVVADYTQPMELPSHAGARGRVGFFPGSTIGNFSPDDAVGFLSRIRALLGAGSALVIGVDLRKAPEILHAAYNDREGVTAAFNLNLLARINRELDADFDLDRFRHEATYDESLGRIEMYLVSQSAQTVRIGAETVTFEAGEKIHTENSYKFTLEGFHELAARAGYETRRVWTDDRDYFSVHYLTARN